MNQHGIRRCFCMFVQGGIYGNISGAFPSPQFLPVSVLTQEPSCASHSEHKHHQS